MEMSHASSANHESTRMPSRMPSDVRLATSATLHCLLGCGLGEVLGMTLGMKLGLSLLHTIILAVVFGFVLGFAFGIIPLMRASYTFKAAMKQVFVTESLSIAVMEAAEISMQLYLGANNHDIVSIEFLIAMTVSLIAGFMAAWPINYMLVKRGVRHQH